MAIDAEEFVAKQKELHRLISDSLRKEHTAADECPDDKELSPAYKNGDAVWLLRPRPVGPHRFKSWWTLAVAERRIGLNTYDISTNRDPVKAAHSSQLKHQLTDLTGAHVDQSYTHEKLSAEDDAPEDDYLIDWILWHRLKPGSRDPNDIEFLVRFGKALASSQVQQMGTSGELPYCLQETLEQLLQVPWPLAQD